MGGNLLYALRGLVHLALNVYIWIVVIRSILSFAGPMPYHPLFTLLRRLTDPLFRLVHRLLPFLVVRGFDLSPMVIVFLLYFLDGWLYNLFTGWMIQTAAYGG